jgi:hypothetical protein
MNVDDADRPNRAAPSGFRRATVPKDRLTTVLTRSFGEPPNVSAPFWPGTVG